MRYSKIELWVTTVLFAIIFFTKLYTGLSEYGFIIERSHNRLDFFVNELLPNLAMIVTTYCAYYVLNFYALPKYWCQKNYLAAIWLMALTLCVTGLLFMICYSYKSNWIYKQYDNEFVANVAFFSRGFSVATAFLMVYCAYVCIRETIIYQYNKLVARQGLGAKIAKEVIGTFSVWLVILIPFFILNRQAFFNGGGIVYLVVLPFCFGVYFFNVYWLIPLYKKRSLQNIASYLLNLLALGVGLGFIEISFLALFPYFGSLASYLLFLWFLPLMISAIVAWWVYNANEDKYKQLALLKTELGASNANLRFLRSQINPHFLFNALNTLYGTALIEQAEKTGEGIQKLGDMMRFMLHENNQDKISLSRDLDYINNYIDLQNLRIALSNNINITINITNQYTALSIAPMLLIPFIENAYKHGISFKQASWINVSLQLADDVLQLDVYNSLHPEKDNDPERERSGIGLENVKQRLQLLYPKKHELVIRQNLTEFFVHLTLHLS